MTLVGIEACKAKSGPEAGSRDGGVAALADAQPPVVRVFVDSGPQASGIPVPESKVKDAINPQHLAPYAGPTGIVEGTITVSGDSAPKQNIEIPFACGEAYGTYGKAFREGNGRTLADVLVAVTGYEGFVPASGDSTAVRIRGCAFDRRTLVLTYGQHIEVENADDKESFVPRLQGAIAPAQMVAVPHGDPVKLYPLEVGHYALSDDTNHNWLYSDVFVLRYPTHAVTGLDGRYRIAGIPAGKVKVNAYAPLIDAQLHPEVGIPSPSQEREIEVKPGETTRVDFTIAYKTPKAPPAKPKQLPERPIVK